MLCRGGRIYHGVGEKILVRKQLGLTLEILAEWSLLGFLGRFVIAGAKAAESEGECLLHLVLIGFVSCCLQPCRAKLELWSRHHIFFLPLPIWSEPSVCAQNLTILAQLICLSVWCGVFFLRRDRCLGLTGNLALVHDHWSGLLGWEFGGWFQLWILVFCLTVPTSVLLFYHFMIFARFDLVL